MTVTALDWTIVMVSVLITFVPALFFTRRGGSSMAEFLTSGKSAP